MTIAGPTEPLITVNPAIAIDKRHIVSLLLCTSALFGKLADYLLLLVPVYALLNCTYPWRNALSIATFTTSQ